MNEIVENNNSEIKSQQRVQPTPEMLIVENIINDDTSNQVMKWHCQRVGMYSNFESNLVNHQEKACRLSLLKGQYNSAKKAD